MPRAQNEPGDGGAATAGLTLLEGPLPAEPRMRQDWLLQQALGLIRLGRPGAAPASPGALPPALCRRQVLLAVAEGDVAAVGE